MVKDRRTARWLDRAAALAVISTFACSAGDEAPANAESATPAQDNAAQAPAPGAEPATETPAEVPQTWEEEGFDTVFSLVDNRHLLHRIDTGLFIDLGHPSGYKYVHGRWHGAHWLAGERDGEHTVAWTDGVRGIVRFPLLDLDHSWELVARMRASSDSQRMDVFLNEEKVGSTLTDLPADEWGEIRIALPRELLVVGENRVRFHFARSERMGDRGRTAGGFDWIRIQPQGVDPLPAHQSGAHGVETVEGGWTALTAPVYGGYAAYLTIPETARLRLRLAASGLAESDAGAPVIVVAHQDGQEPRTLWEGEATSETRQVEVDLSAYAGEVIRLELLGTAPVGPGEILWIDPHLAVMEGEHRALGPESRPEMVLVWLIDTLRTDHYPVYNPETRVQAPNAVAFADNCVAFRRHTVQGNSSLPASASIHTSTYPAVHQLYSGGRHLPRDVTRIAQPFDDAGFATALYSSNGYVSDHRGFERGFDTYRNLIHEPGRADSEYLWPQVREWLEAHTEGQRFVFVNTIDPHVPYDPPAEILAQYFPGNYSGRIQPRGTGELLDQLGDRVLEGEDLRYLMALYDGEITSNDLYFGEMIEWLRQNGQLDDTLIVITSDHGEGFFEHGRGGHGAGVYEEVVHVPLMLCHPRSLGAGRWIDVEVESIDLMPTLIDVMGLPPAETAQGVSLLPLILDDTPSLNRPAFSYHADDVRGARLGHWKYIHRGGDQDALYDLRESALEGENRRDEAPIAYRFMRDVMSFHLAFETEWNKRQWGWANNHSATLAALLDDSVW